MKRKRTFFLSVALIVLTLLLPLVVLAQTTGMANQESADTLQEQALAWAAEQEGMTPWTPVSGLSSLGVDYPLLVGVDDANIPAYQIAPLTNISVTAFSGAQVWGAAYDPVNDLVYFNSGATLYEWPVGGTINPLGTIVDPAGATQSMVGLAFYDGQLYGTKNIANEAIWAINPNTLIATVVIDYVDADLDCGGFAADPNDGTFYCTNDDTTPYGAGLLIINQDATVTPVAPYPAGQTDIDGLAVSDDGYAYLVIDEPGSIYVYDFAAGDYTTPLTNPWTTSEVFSAGAWIWDMVEPPVIEVDPAELSQVQVTGSQITRTLTISNSGGSDLEWAIGEAGQTASFSNLDNVAFAQIGSCDPPVDLPWVSVNPISGTVASGTAVDVDVIFDSTSLAAGVYTGTLCMNNNDPIRPLVEVPLTMTVIAYGVDLSGDQAADGEVGTTVTYTIQLTNTGSVTDTFDLTATGGAWTTTVSSSVTLAAGETVSLTVQVEVPGDAGDGDSDMTTVTAVSQTDTGESDTLMLTTTAVITQQFIYLPVILKP